MGHQVSIIGQGEHTESIQEQGIVLHSIQRFSRLSLHRFLYSLLIFPKAYKQKADFYTLHSPELLGLGLLLKLLLRARIIYDVHEDYAANIRAAQHYPTWLRRPLAWLVRCWERLAMYWVDQVSYAEICYDNLLQVKPNRYAILPNTFSPKAAIGIASVAIPEQPYLLYTGTIAKEWGLFEAIDVWEQINIQQPMSLIVAGHTYRQEILDKLQAHIERSPFRERFQLIGGDSYVPYVDILHLIQHCVMGIGLYHLLPHIQGKIPTKFYEYMAYNKPLLYPDDPTWKAFDAAHRLGIIWHPDRPIEDILSDLVIWQQNPPQHDPESYSWEASEGILQLMLDA